MFFSRISNEIASSLLRILFFQVIDAIVAKFAKLAVKERVTFVTDLKLDRKFSERILKPELFWTQNDDEQINILQQYLSGETIDKDVYDVIKKIAKKLIVQTHFEIFVTISFLSYDFMSFKYKPQN